MRLLTIGFTQQSAERFFGLLHDSGAGSLTDVRLNNVSQLAGFAKRDDLAWLLRSLNQMDYRHEPLLAPRQELLDGYRKRGDGWAAYEAGFLDLLTSRQVESVFRPGALDNTVLLCSEPEPTHGHRWLVAEYLGRAWGNIQVTHLV